MSADSCIALLQRQRASLREHIGLLSAEILALTAKVERYAVHEQHCAQWRHIGPRSTNNWKRFPEIKCTCGLNSPLPSQE